MSRFNPLEHSHDPKQIAMRLEAAPRHSYLRDFVYGAIDGTVTTFAVVSGVAGAGLSSGIIIILGIANLVGDGFSMAASNYLGTRTDEQLRDKARQMEHRHIASDPDGEREEIRQIFAMKGFAGDDLERVVDVITADDNRWVDAMLTDELKVPLDGPSPIRAAVITFIAFIIVGFLPLVTFVLQAFAPSLVSRPYLWSTLLTGMAFFGVGAAKSRFVDESWFRSGVETLLIGGSAASLAYLVGVLLRGVVSI